MKIVRFLIALVVCFGASAIGSAFTMNAIPTWYATLNKASFNPPNWIFGPVWTLLYTLMAVSLFIVWEKGRWDKEKAKAFGIFFAQLLANTLWSVVFFGFKMPGVAFLIIIVLWLLIVSMIISFKKFSNVAAWLQVPYIVWVSFASVLNFFIWRLN